VAARALGGDTLAEMGAGLIALALAPSISSMTMAGRGSMRAWPMMAACRAGSDPRLGTATAGILLQTVLALAMLWTRRSRVC